MSEETNTETTESPKGPGVLRAVGIVAALVALEMVGAAMLIPSAEETEDLARDLTRAAHGDEIYQEGEDQEVTVDPVERTKEIELCAKNITRFNPESDSVLNVDFVVFGVVQEEDEAVFLEEFEANRSRIEEQIVMTMHGAETSDLGNAGLGLIKRRILEKTNRALGLPLLHEVGFTKINFVER